MARTTWNLPLPRSWRASRLGRLVAAAPDRHVAGGRHGGLAGGLHLGHVHRRGGRAVDLQVRIAHQRGELGRGLGLVPQQVLTLLRIRQRHLPGALGHLSVALAAAVALPGGLLREARHALRALVLLAAAAVARRGAQGHPLPSGQRLEVVDQREVALVEQQQRRVLGGALVGRGPLLQDVEVLLPVLPLGALPREDEDLHPAGVPTLEGVDVLKAHWAVGRQAGEVQPRIGQSGLPAGRAAPGAGLLGVEEGARAGRGPLAFRQGELVHAEAVSQNAPHEAAVVRVPRVPNGLLLGQALGQLLPAAARLVRRRRRGDLPQLLRGRRQQVRGRDAHKAPIGLREARALERHLKLRPDGSHHGACARGQRRCRPHDPRGQLQEVVLELQAPLRDPALGGTAPAGS